MPFHVKGAPHCAAIEFVDAENVKAIDGKQAWSTNELDFEDLLLSTTDHKHLVIMQFQPAGEVLDDGSDAEDVKVEGTREELRRLLDLQAAGDENDVGLSFHVEEEACDEIADQDPWLKASGE